MKCWRHQWSKWSDPYNVPGYANRRQSRECVTCGLVRERML